MSALAGVASLFTVLIVASSALIRRWHEGMGCEAWAGCAALFRAEADAVPAAIEIARLAHRVSASTVGVLVALLLLYGWQSFDRGRRAAALAAVGVTLFLASLGRHSSLASAPVTLGNVLGGTVLVFALGWLASRPSGPLDAPGPASATQGWFVGASALVACLLLAASVASGVALGERHAWLATAFVVAALYLVLAPGRQPDRRRGLSTAFVVASLVGQAVTGVAMAAEALPLVAAAAHSALSAVLAGWLGACLGQRSGRLD
jgi:heme A synthase